ncbi:MAG TPA: insulinase family protein, partial [Gemmatimonadaceae bacterium]|nr:insulinase family protein [Gemmatimonadaceae bacterium]
SSLVDEYVNNFLIHEPSPGIGYEVKAAHDFLPTVTLADVNAVGRELITDRNRVVLVEAPEKADVRVPDRAALLAVFDRVRRDSVTAYVDSTSNEPLLRDAPKPGRIVGERTVREVGVTEWRLSNGARVLVKPTDFQADQVLLRAYSPGGTSLLADRDLIAGATSSFIVSIGGVGTLSATALGKRLAGKDVSVRPNISSDEEGMSGNASPRDLELLLQLTYLYFTAPRADSGAFAALLDQARASLANRGASPEVAFSDTLEALLTQHSPRTRPFTIDRVREMNLARSIAIYRDRFADAGDFTFVLVGNVNVDSLRPLVERYLASLPSSGRTERARDLGIRPPAGVVEATVRRGTEPKAQTSIVFTGDMPAFTRAERLAVGALADVLEIQLRETLREQLGGTYGVQVGAQTERDPKPHYSLTINFGSAPDRVEALTGALFAQLDTLATRGPSAATLAKVKEARLRDRETSLKQNGYWINQIATFDRYNWPLTDIPKGDALVNSLDAATVQRAARAYLNRKRYVRVVLVPESR